MPFVSIASLARFASVFYAVGAVRSAVRIVEDFLMIEDEKPAFTRDTSMICGGPQIWGEVVQERSAFESAMNVNWKQVEAFKDAFLVEQASKREILSGKLDKLTRLLEAELANEKPRTTEEHIKLLLEAGLGEGSYGGSENARVLKCGKPGARRGHAGLPRVRGAYAQSQKLFAAESKAFFAKAQFRLDGGLFLDICHAELVEEGDTHLESWCVPLCQKLKDIAAGDSKEALGEAAGAADRLKDDIAEAKKALAAATTSKEQCEGDWSSLVVFRDQLLELKDAYKQRFDEMMDAELALDDAMYESEELQENLEAMEAELKAADELLQEAGGSTAEATAALEEAASKEKALSDSARTTLADLTALRAELADVQAADDMVEKLKVHVTKTMLTMKGFSNAAIKEPLRNLGFDEPGTEAALFPEPEATDAAVAARAAVESMHDYCASTAMPAFEEVRQMISVGGEPLDLTDLCRFAEPDAVLKDLSKQVKIRADVVKADLVHVESWLNPYRSKRKVSMEEAFAQDQELVKGGQLANLEEVKSDYYASVFFKYLIGWRKGGPHHLRIAGLAGAIAKLKAAESDLQAKLDDLQALLLAAQSAHKAAVESLERATEAQSLAADKKAELEKSVARLQEQGAQMSRDLAELQAALEKAQKEVREAQAALEGAYTAGTTKEAALTELEAESAVVQQRISELERAIASSTQRAGA